MTTLTIPAIAAAILTHPQTCETCGGEGYVERLDYRPFDTRPDELCPSCHGSGSRPSGLWVAVPGVTCGCFPHPTGLVGQRVDVKAGTGWAEADRMYGPWWSLDGELLRHRDTGQHVTLRPGEIVGTAVVGEVLPIWDSGDAWERPCLLVDRGRLIAAHGVHPDPCTDISDALPYSTWTPGHWAVRLDEPEAR